MRIVSIGDPTFQNTVIQPFQLPDQAAWRCDRCQAAARQHFAGCFKLVAFLNPIGLKRDLCCCGAIERIIFGAVVEQRPAGDIDECFSRQAFGQNQVVVGEFDMIICNGCRAVIATDRTVVDQSRSRNDQAIDLQPMFTRNPQITGRNAWRHGIAGHQDGTQVRMSLHISSTVVAMAYPFHRAHHTIRGQDLVADGKGFN